MVRFALGRRALLPVMAAAIALVVAATVAVAVTSSGHHHARLTARGGKASADGRGGSSPGTPGSGPSGPSGSGATPSTAPGGPPLPIAPLTGLPEPAASQVGAPAVVVKIDNSDAARPQTGLNQADIVYEEMVEAGITRLAAIFQSHYPDPVGPIRSGRLTDEGIADDLNHPVYAYSGTNNIFLPILRSQPLTDVDPGLAPGQFFRTGYAAAPHNLYARVTNLAALSSARTAPNPLFVYRPLGTPLGGSGVAPASGVGIGWPAASVSWTWDTRTNVYDRTQNGSPDVDRSGHRLTAANVVIMNVNYTVSGIATGEGVPDAPIPDGQLVGSGPVTVLSGGAVVHGTWTRASLTTPATFTDASGAAIALYPGETYIELAPTGDAPTVRG